MTMKRAVLSLLVLGAVGTAGAAWYWPRVESQSLRLPGNVEVQEVRLGSKAGGRVTGVHVKESDTVEAGKALISVETDELTARRDRAKSRLVVALANLDKANSGPL